MADATKIQKPVFSPPDFPYIDPAVQHVGVSKLRNFNATNLSEIDKTLVIQDPNFNPLAVLLKYEQYLAIQKQLQSLVETINILSNPKERERLQDALKQVRQGELVDFDDLNGSKEKAPKR